MFKNVMLWSLTVNVIPKFHPFRSISNKKKHKYTFLTNEISVFTFFEIFKKFKWAIYWYHLITWTKEIHWLLYEFGRTDYVGHGKQKLFWKKMFWIEKTGVICLCFFCFNCGKIFVVRGISYCYITVVYDITQGRGSCYTVDHVIIWDFI